MKTVKKEILSISIFSSLILLNGCASSSHEVISVSDTHLYNEDYGIIPDKEADSRIEAEILAQNRPTEIEIIKSDDPDVTTELMVDPEAVTADKLIIPKPVITYKYPFDPKFYTENQLKKR